jgi:hypothetical protein
MSALENEEMPKTTILLETKTREELRLLGTKGESYDVIIRRLIDHWKKSKK